MGDIHYHVSKIKFPIHSANQASVKRITNETFWVAFGVFFSTIGSFAGVRLLTSVMSPGDYGRLALGVSIAMGLVYSIGVALWGAITRFFSVAKTDGRAEWYWQSIKNILVRFGAALCIVGMVTALILKLDGFKTSEVWFWFLAILFGGVQVVGETGSALQNGARNRKMFSLHQNLLGWGRFIMAYVIIRLWLPGAQGAMLGFVIAAIGVMLSQRYWVKKKILKNWSKKDLKKNRSKEFFNYFKPLAFSGVFIWIQLFADRWALNSFASLDDVGIYFALYQISFAPALYCSSFLNHLLGPVFYNRAGDGSDQYRFEKTAVLNEKIAGFILIFIVLGVGIAFFCGPIICAMLIDPKYSHGFWAFPWLVATSGIYSLGQQLLMSVYSGTDTTVFVPFRMVMMFVAIVCYMSGGIFFGFTGIIAGGFIFSVLYLFLSFFMHRRVGLSKRWISGEGNGILL